MTLDLFLALWRAKPEIIFAMDDYAAQHPHVAGVAPPRAGKVKGQFCMHISEAEQRATGVKCHCYQCRGRDEKRAEKYIGLPEDTQRRKDQ